MGLRHWPCHARSWLRHELPNGIRGVIFWLPFAWRWRSWDWAYGMLALERHLVALEKACREGHGVRAEKDAREIRQALFLLRRILKDEYFLDTTPPDFPRKWEWWEKSQRDWDALFPLLQRRMRGWWD